MFKIKHENELTGDELAIPAIRFIEEIEDWAEKYAKTKSITVATDCMEWLAKLLEIDDEKQQFNGGQK